ncbi:MAG TPA: transporter substrate-binding domain-containing protein, partial [Anaerolineae bacterium]|nr:transporter substrate-binding domain-containing protein [Anaerolineae bacterium]
PSGALAAILQRGTLVVATEADYAPQSELKRDEPRAADTQCAPNQRTENQFEGFDMDVAREVARRLGVELCLVTPRWTQVVSGNWDDLWDVSIGSMVITPERMQVLYFAQPYTSGAAVLFVHEDNETTLEPGNLSGKRIGVCAGCAYEAYLEHSLVVPNQEIDFAIDDPTIVGYDTDTSALQDLAAGDGVRLDAVLTDPDTGRSAIEGGLPLKQLGNPLYYDFVAAAVDKSSRLDPVPLVQRITEVIQEMHADGTLARLSRQYYGDDWAQYAAEFDIEALEQFP